MSSQLSAVSAPPATKSGAAIPWTGMIWFGVLLAIPYSRILADMVHEWFTSEDMGHGLFVPLVCGYLVWQSRYKILDPEDPPKPNRWGIVLIVWGFFQAILGTLGADFFIARTAFLVALLGMIVTFGGFSTVRKLAFPLFLLLFMIRIPLFLYSRITLPLQQLASEMAADGLSLIGIPVMRQGNVLELASQKLDVVEACSGIRSLISLSFLSLVYGYFFERKQWTRIVLLISAIPIAIICNAGRITITGILSQYEKQFAQGVYHSLEGWVIFVAAVCVLVIFHQLLSRMSARVHVTKTQLSA